MANLTRRKGEEGEQQRQLRRRRDRLLSFYPLPGVLPRGDKELDSLDAPACTIAGDPKARGGGEEQGPKKVKTGGGSEQGRKRRRRQKPRPSHSRSLRPPSPATRSPAPIAVVSGSPEEGDGTPSSKGGGGGEEGGAAVGGEDLEEPAPGAAARLGPGRRLCVGGWLSWRRSSSLRLAAGRTLVVDFGFYRHPSAIGHWAEVAGQLASHVFSETRGSENENESATEIDDESGDENGDENGGSGKESPSATASTASCSSTSLAATSASGPEPPWPRPWGSSPGGSLPPIYFQEGVEALSDLQASAAAAAGR